MQITISDEQKEIRLNKKKIKEAAQKVLKRLGLPEETSLSVTFVSKARIRGLNRRYFKRDRPTDVLAFGYRKIRDSKRGPYRHYLGDIIISPGVASESSKVYNNSFFGELSLYLIHGILHLAGYKDTSRASRMLIEKKEKEILRSL